MSTTTPPGRQLIFRPISLSGLLGDNLAVILGQVCWALFIVIDAYFVSQLGGDLIYEFSFVQSLNVMVTSFIAGMMQSFLIFGSRELFGGDPRKFATILVSTLGIVMLASLLLHLAAFGFLWAQSHWTSRVPVQSYVLALYVIPGMVVVSLVNVFRLKLIIEKRKLQFLLASVFAVAVKLGIVVVLLRNADALSAGPGALIAALQLSSGLLALGFVVFLSLRKRDHSFADVELGRLLPQAGLLISVGIPIGIVIFVEYLTFAGAQYILSASHPERAEYFALAMQVLLALEIVAVALAQVITALVASSMGQGRAHIRQICWMSTALAIGIFAAIGVLLAWFAPHVAGFVFGNEPGRGPEAVTLLTENLYVVAGLQALLGLVILFAGILRGFGDVARPLLLLLVNYGLLGLGTIVALIHFTDLTEAAAWIGIGVCLVSSVLVLFARINHRIEELDDETHHL